MSLIRYETETKYDYQDLGTIVYTVVHTEEISSSEPTGLLIACENAEKCEYGIPINVDCETIPSTEGELWHISADYISPPESAVIEESEDFLNIQPFEVSIHYELGSPGSATATIYGGSYPIGGLYRIFNSSAGSLFTGYITDIESWTETVKTENGSEIQYPVSRIQLVDVTKRLSESVLLGPYFFPGMANNTIPYNDGTDHFISIRDAIAACFSLAGMSADFNGLPNDYGFHSGLHGESTWIVKATTLDAIVNTAYELTGIRCWADSNGIIHFGGGGGAISGMALASSGATDRYYRTGIKGYGNGIQVSVGNGPQWGYFIEESISDPDELRAACNYILAQCQKNRITYTFKGRLGSITTPMGIVMPGNNILSVDINITNQIMKEVATNQIKQNNWIDEVTVVMGYP